MRSLATPDTFDNEIDLAASKGLEGMKVDNIKPPEVLFVFPPLATV